jgi:DNA-binding GntR family transcriptional regulator
VSVKRVTFGDFKHLYECRLSLEPTAAYFAALRISEMQRIQMSKLMYQMQRAIEKKEIDELKTLGSQFHEMILEASENPYLIKMMKHLYALMTFYRNAILNIPQRIETGADEHDAIWEAIRKGDAESAETLMREHIQNDYHFYLSVYQNTSGENLFSIGQQI